MGDYYHNDDHDVLFSSMIAIPVRITHHDHHLHVHIHTPITSTKTFPRSLERGKGDKKVNNSQWFIPLILKLK